LAHNDTRHRPANTPSVPLLAVRGGEEKKLRGTPPETPDNPDMSGIVTPSRVLKKGSPEGRSPFGGGLGVSPRFNSPFQERKGDTGGWFDGSRNRLHMFMLTPTYAGEY